MSNFHQAPNRIVLPEIQKKERASINPDSESSTTPQPKNVKDGLYEVKPNFIARKIDDKELFEDNSHKINMLEQINEDLIDEYEETTPQKQTLPMDYEQEPVNIFKSDMLTSMRYKEHSKGPIVLNGHVVRHSVCGPVELFQSAEKKSRKGGHKDSVISVDKESSDTSIAKNQRPVSNSKSVEPSMSFNAGHQAIQKKSTEKKKESKKEVQISREDFFNQLDKLKETEDKFYQDQAEKVQNLQKGDYLYLTKQQRCLDKFSKTQGDWNRIVQKNNMKIGREPEKSVTSRIDDFRQKRELLNVFETIKTDNEKFGTMIWYTTLRKTTPNLNLVKKMDDYPDAFDQTVFEKNKEKFEVISRPGTHHGGLTFNKSHTKFFGRSGREYVEEKYSQKPRALQALHPANYNELEDLIVSRNSFLIQID